MNTAPHKETVPAESARIHVLRTPLDGVLDELCAAVFTSLPRRDQRRRGEEYVRGLLSTPGRKSIRNMASRMGGSAAEQSLQHFITNSTWQWRQVRAALTRYLDETHALSAWVVQPMAIPKSGEHSVGVGRRFDPHLGQVTRGQQSFGVWFASQQVVTPVGWRLFLPEPGPDSSPEEPSAATDTSAEGETYEESVAAAVMETVPTCAMPRRPVVLDVRGIGTRATMNHFTAVGLPVIARIEATAPLLVADPAMPGYGAGPVPARDILSSVRGLRHPVPWGGDTPQGAPGTSLAAAMPVAMPGPAHTRRKPLLLLGEWTDPHRAPSQLWVTNIRRTPMASLMRLAKQADRVSHTVSYSAPHVGLRDFAGRSLPGWHRHLTLASVAHAAKSLAELSHRAPAEMPAALTG